ncbi:hypothetical protein GPX89_25720 [Nocardia sp. ET3-3]|uniref:Uncharacterized protein n=1 Tax=Nocardia terrae TaxID=2675851 RepID=A0A7K1V1X7_9NOCA|nr:hypothetical protein [Nocardia terrae]MVU80636.1 hypothetical protein [Nocardia terrae]
MADEAETHRDCVGGCMPQLPKSALAKRAKRHKLGEHQLDQLLQALDGRCMICQRCHAMYIDTTTRAATVRLRGVVCRWCKQRIAVHEGSYGNERGVLGCRCRPRDDPEWEPRMAAATAQYLERTARLTSYATDQEWFEALIDDLSVHGPDPSGVWSGIPLSDLPQLTAPESLPTAEFDRSCSPLARQRCADNCRNHDEHIYIACFAEPTKLRDADTFDAVMHYVGWTRQRPPVRRVNQHGAICRKSLIAIVPGTETEEAHLKDEAQCPQCGRPLRYN